MKTTAIAALGILFMALPASSQSCTEYLEQQILTMENAAGDCGISSEEMHTAPGLNDPVELNCRGGLQDTSSQWTQLQQCARVFACASLSYQCALEQVQAGADCQAAMSDCLGRVGVRQ